MLAPGYVFVGDEAFFRKRCRDAVLQQLVPADVRELKFERKQRQVGSSEVYQDYLRITLVTAAGKRPNDAVLQTLGGGDIILWPDADDAGYQHMQDVAVALCELGIESRIVLVPGAHEKDDAVEFIAAFHSAPDAGEQPLIRAVCARAVRLGSGRPARPIAGSPPRRRGARRRATRACRCGTG